MNYYLRRIVESFVRKKSSARENAAAGGGGIFVGCLNKKCTQMLAEDCMKRA